MKSKHVDRILKLVNKMSTKRIVKKKKIMI